MTKAQHTPGPWRVTNSGGVFFFVQPAGSADIIAHVDWLDNARLIAAAPEMLAALEEVLSAVADAAGHPDHCFIDLSVQQVDNIARTIAKAKGE